MQITIKTAEAVTITDSLERAVSILFENRKENKPAVIVLTK